MSASVQCGSLGHDLRVFVAARRERALDLVSRLRVSGRGPRIARCATALGSPPLFNASTFAFSRLAFPMSSSPAR